MDSPHLLSMGHGYVASLLGQQLQAEGWKITGTSRAPLPPAGSTDHGVVRLHWRAGDPLSAALTEALATATHLLISVPPGPEGDPVLDAVQELIHDGSAPRLSWVGLLSTIGVYGDHQGEWVDESTPPTPGLARTLARLEAEQEWKSALKDSAIHLQIFRIAGIYGPGRSLLDRLRAGTARRIVKEGGVFNRVHVDDIVSAVRLGMDHAGSDVFNVTDDLPTPPDELLLYACELLEMEPPPLIPFEAAQLSPMGRSFFIEDRRVKATRLKEVLGWTPRYPTYREGLRALLDA